MSEIAGNSAHKTFSFCHLGFKSSTHNLPEEQWAENPRNVGQTDDVKTVVVD